MGSIFCCLARYGKIWARYAPEMERFSLDLLQAVKKEFALEVGCGVCGICYHRQKYFFDSVILGWGKQ